MKQRNWQVGPTHTDKRDEYTNLGGYKNCCGTFTKKTLMKVSHQD